MSGKNVTVYHKDKLVDNGRAIELHTREILKISSRGLVFLCRKNKR